jgi:hypothetical protein
MAASSSFTESPRQSARALSFRDATAVASCE